MKAIFGSTVIVAIAAFALQPIPAWGQPGGPTPPAAAPPVAPSGDEPDASVVGGGVYLLQLARQKSVQSELHVSRAQQHDLDALERTMQKRANEAQKVGPQLLTGAQGVSGSRGLVPSAEDIRIQKETAQQLPAILGDGQVKRLKQIALQQQGPHAVLSPAIVAKLQLTDAQIKRVERLTPWDSNKVDGLLAGRQREIWREMTGAPFRGRLTPFQPPKQP